MDMTRRAFIGTVPAVAAAARLDAGPARTTRDPLGVRDDFPVATSETYLNSAYITPSPLPVVDAAAEFLRAKADEPVSLGDMLAEVDRVRAAFARLIGARTEEIGTLFATSDGENVVTRALELGPGDNIVVDDLHYETTYLLYQELARERGIELRVVPSTEGAAPAETWAEHVDAGTRLVSVSWVSHQNGYRHDLRALADLAHARGAYLYVDAIQGVGSLALDVAGAGVDFLTAGTYKWLLGGFGVAPFYVRAELLDRVPPDRYGSLHIDGDEGPGGYRIYQDGKKYGYATMAFGAVYQLGAALAYLDRVGVPRIEAHTVALAHRLRSGLVEQGFRVWTPPDNRSAIVSFIHERDPENVASVLERERIRVSLRENGAHIRAGLALFNTDEDVDRMLAVTAAL